MKYKNTVSDIPGTAHGLIKEKTTMVFAYCGDDALKEHIETVINYCEKLKSELTQESIALELNGEMYFI